ncbi:hypothetical protein AHMF7605_00095 [Adhaeribacter arboris]|uniref:Nucleoside 2-deoxyribosyltransferase n=1 Tax=Adhaeribacter arboris TaxID=2072846 RepID=A0A2T2Y934_9BACT|nr:hypothetical protein [Adhaeribacter arboris]PSR52030.1 hypothetical protein AHMF7605_00095 [Adhaeribacter arboris]
MNSLLLFLFSLQKVDGEQVFLDYNKPWIFLKNYFSSPSEFLFYLKGLEESDFINFKPQPQIHDSDYSGYFQIIHKGLNQVVELSKVEINSKTCFMAFDNRTKPYRKAIKNAISKTGYKVIIIDEEHINSDKTIPDAILSGIKQSKFCVADFTLHRNGVYFESGYALGLGKSVIYTCHKDDFSDSHFDIKQLQHIIYNTPEDLERMLVDKIEAWIK